MKKNLEERRSEVWLLRQPEETKFVKEDNRKVGKVSSEKKEELDIREVTIVDGKILAWESMNLESQNVKRRKK